MPEMRKILLNKRLLFALGALALFGLGYWFGSEPGSEPTAPLPTRQEAAANASREEAKPGVTWWTCSMHPQIKLPGPGKCPICFMDLIPMEQDTDQGKANLRQITLSPTARELARVEIAKVVRRDVPVDTRMVGTIAYDETREGVITAWVGGRIDKLYVDYTGDFVKKGQRMADIYSPELYAAQAELIQAYRALPKLEKSRLAVIKESAERTRAAAREKLRLLGLTQRQINDILKQGKPSDHVTLHAPMAGVVVDKKVDEGVYVKTGSPIYTIADISRVWVMLQAYEADLPWVKMGGEVTFTAEAYPGKEFRGKVVYIDPFLNPKTRTVGVRLDAANPGYELKPGMFVRAVQRSDADKEAIGGEPPLVIPASAPLVTGKRAVVYLAVPGREGVYEGRQIVLGPKAGNFYIVRAGLKEGEEVVVRGAFLIDSAVQIMAEPSMMSPVPAAVGGMMNMDMGGKKDAAMAQPQAGLKAPQPFLKDILALSGPRRDLSAAMASGDLEATHLAFKALGARLDAVDASGLAGETDLMWKELSMLLGNDAVIGAEAPAMGDARWTASQMAEHWRRLDQAFDLKTARHRAEAAPGAPETFRSQLGDVFEAYRPVAEALARDDFETAKEHAEGVAKALAGVDMELLQGSAHTEWMQDLHRMQQGLDALREAQSLDQARQGFQSLSAGLSAAAGGLGLKAASAVYEFHCSMAFDGEGADWLQANQSVRNPYFGPAMQTCGEVVRRFDQPGQEAETPAQPAAPTAFRRQLGKVAAAYAVLSDSLARDDAEAARKAAASVDKALAGTDINLLPMASRDLWTASLAGMRKGLDVLEKAKGIVTMRVGFEAVSNGLIQAVRGLGTDTPGPLYVLFCPMAFKNKGALWLQPDDEIRNPYFGKVMQTCGEVRQTLKGE
ncbi:MAG: rane fusion protein copper/silver efflux system [Desulfovibrionales bacterium]|nr:rane fusion protein copper/silver efflux system [Desulfovibrionales bacterium]